jgi:hypothetical protein
MTELLTEDTAEHAAGSTWRRDQLAWNLPRVAEEDAAAPSSTSDPELDWAAFSKAYYPESRRHNLPAIAAYAAYKRARRDG